MSEKLYKVTEDVDHFSEDILIPNRCLVFKDKNGILIKKFFPEDRTTLFFQGDPYDWYGRLVKIPDGVKILKPLGYCDGCSFIREKFLVSTPDHRLAFAWLSYSNELPIDQNFPLHYKHKLLHARLSYVPILKLEKWSFQKTSIYNLPVLVILNMQTNT